MVLLYFIHVFSFSFWILGKNNKPSLLALAGRVHWTQNGGRLLIYKREFSSMFVLCNLYLMCIIAWSLLFTTFSCAVYTSETSLSIHTMIVNVFYNVCNFLLVLLVPHFFYKANTLKSTNAESGQSDFTFNTLHWVFVLWMPKLWLMNVVLAV